MSKEFIELSKEINKLFSDDVVSLTISNPRNKDVKYRKITMKYIADNDSYYQFTYFTDTQVFHENMDTVLALETLKHLSTDYRQIDGKTMAYNFNTRISKKYKVHTSKQVVDNSALVYYHDRPKDYLITEYENFPVLQDLGIITKDNQVIPAQSSKLRQINKFVELIVEVIKDDQIKKLNIVDFGCGRSYLTFLLYDYLTQYLDIEVKMTGLDLKKDVIKQCNHLKEKYNYENLEFIYGDIAEYKTSEKIDMVISLHACDVATDFALDQAITWGAKYIFSVPCCQHEVYRQIDNSEFDFMLGHGIVKERFSALLTDSIRSQVLAWEGYDSQIIEFIDVDDSLKNLMIRAKKTTSINKEMLEEINHIQEKFNLDQTWFVYAKR